MAAQIPTMTKPRPNPPPQREGSPAPARKGNGRPPLAVRVVVSVILVWHLFAVVMAPFSVPPTSWLVSVVTQEPPVQWYLDLLYINHGYQFFAPDPSSGRLVRWEILDNQGRVIEQQRGEFPNKKEQWPRLWYHRHFMLADQAGSIPEDEQTPDKWRRRFLEAYGRHLLRKSPDGAAVRLRWIEHRPLDPAAAFQGATLDDPSTYRQLLPDIIVRRSDLGPDESDQTNIWQSGRQNVAGRPGISPWTRVTR